MNRTASGAASAPSRRRTVLVACPGADMYGADRMAARTVDVLLAAGWRVVFTAPAPGPLIDVIEDLGASVEPCPMPILRRSEIRPRHLLGLPVRLIACLIPAVRLLRRVHPDIVYVNTVTAPLWLVLARALGIVSVCHVREAEAHKSRTYLRLLLLPLFSANSLLFNSEYSRGVLASAYRRLATRGTVVYNTLPHPSEPRPPRPRLDPTCRLLFVGRLIPRKGLHVALEAMAGLRARGVDVTLDVVGSQAEGYEDHVDQLHSQIASTGLADVVAWHGFQSEVWPHLADCDIALIPSALPEPYGNTAVEAVLAERPRVVSDFPGLREATRESEATIVVPPGDGAALADAVATIVDQWDRFRAAARDDAARRREVNTKERYAQDVTGAFDELLDTDTRLDAV